MDGAPFRGGGVTVGGWRVTLSTLFCVTEGLSLFFHSPYGRPCNALDALHFVVSLRLRALWSTAFGSTPLPPPPPPGAGSGGGSPAMAGPQCPLW